MIARKRFNIGHHLCGGCSIVRRFDIAGVNNVRTNIRVQWGLVMLVVPRSSVSLVLRFRLRVNVRLGLGLGSVYCTFALSHLRSIEPADYRYTIHLCIWSNNTAIKVYS